jgi:hypothetical protein
MKFGFPGIVVGTLLSFLCLSLLVPSHVQCQTGQRKAACDDEMTFCWYGEEIEAWGGKWVSQDGKDTIEASVAFRCFKSLGICICASARAIEVPKDRRHIINNIDISRVTHWDDQQITAKSENFDWEPCDRDSYIINRMDRAVILISSPGSKADTSTCTNILGKPRTVTYKLRR